jgi:APA family basic amino acid/polyamine antiporter
MMLGQTRVFWSMSRDGLLPPFVSRVHPRFKTPWLITIVTGVVVAFFGAVLPVRDAGNLCNIGTLLAFVIVSVGVLVLRVREPELQRKFKVPAIWFVAPMGALSAFALMLYLPLMTWMRLLVWFLVGMVIYFGYSRRHSKLERPTVQTRTD